MTAPLPDDEAMRLRHGSRDERQRLQALAAEDPALAARLAGWDRQDAALRALYAPVADEPVPERLRAVLLRVPPAASSLWRIAAALVLLGCGFAGGWGVARLAPPSDGPLLARAAIGSYATYAVEVAHPVEVPASDEAHLVKWLSKRLGTAIRPPDLAAEGFRLIGGRLLPGDISPAALLMYEDDLGRRLALYVTRSTGRDSDLAFAEEQGAQAFWWVEGNLGCALVGDLPRDLLRRLAISAYHGLTET
jgi:anti-sigma factor RsiW